MPKAAFICGTCWRQTRSKACPFQVLWAADAKAFGGNGFADDSVTHLTNYDPLYVGEHKEWPKLYIPARSAVVLKKN